jgi:hypothetical protein
MRPRFMLLLPISELVPPALQAARATTAQPASKRNGDPKIDAIDIARTREVE